MHNPLFRQKLFISERIKRKCSICYSWKIPPKQSHPPWGSVCAHSTVVFLNIRVTKYLPLGIRSWQPSLMNRILLGRWSSISFNGIIRTHALLKCERGAISSWTEQCCIYYFAGVTPNPHYLLKRDSNSSDVVLSTLNRCSSVRVNKTLPYQMHQLILKRANLTQ